MQIFKQITDVFNWLQSTGILAAAATLILVTIKQLQPYLKTHIKDKQMNQLAQFALTSVTKFATLVGLSKSDRKKAADKDVTDFANLLNLKWVTPEIVDSIVESAYQQLKKLHYDNHAPQTDSEPDPSASQDAQVPASTEKNASESASEAPEMDPDPVAPATPEKSDSNA